MRAHDHLTVKHLPNIGWLLRRDNDLDMHHAKVGLTRFEAIVEAGNMKKHTTENIHVEGLHP